MSGQLTPTAMYPAMSPRFSYSASFLLQLDRKDFITWYEADTAAPMSSPPSYESLDHGAYRQRSATEQPLEQQAALFKPLTPPPQTKYFVKAATEPSFWRLLTGQAMSNVANTRNIDPLRKQRYRVIYPPDYEDVWLHKSTWQSNAEPLPHFHAELFGRDGYESEPLAILGPEDYDESLTNEAINIAAAMTPKVFSRIEDEVTKTAHFAAFCENEFCSWDWSAKTNGAKRDMKSLISRARKECLKCASLILGLEQLLAFIRRDDEGQGCYFQLIRNLRRMISDTSAKLDQLRL